MAIKETVSGMGANSSRTDKNLSERVARVQRNAKIQNSSNGAYGARADLQSIAAGAPTQTPMPQVNMQPQSPVSSVASVNAFAPGSGLQGAPLSDGAQFGPGRDASAQPSPVDAPNPDSIFVRAMAAANPGSRQLMMMVEAYNEMEAN